MYFLFIDESGTPPKREKAAGQYLVIGGVVVPEGTWHGLSKDFNRLKQRYEVRCEVKWKFFGSGNKQANNGLRLLAREQVERFRRELFGLITSRKAVKIISCVVCIEAAYDISEDYTQDDIYHLAYKGVTERFQYFLQDASRVTGQNQYGIVVSDHRMNSNDQSLRTRHHQLIDSRSPFSSAYTNILETIFFAPSEVSVGIQMADMVAGALHRYFQHRDDQFARLLMPSFRTSPAGKIDGFGVVKMPKGNFR